MLSTEELVPELYEQEDPRVVIGPDRPARVDPRPPIDPEIRAAAIALVAGVLVFLVGLGGLLSRWVGPAAWWVVAIGVGAALVCGVGLVPVRAIIMGGLLQFPLRDWRPSAPPKR